MARTVAVANQKGGVAKTTTVHALGRALAELGERVLLVDLDPQACLTTSLGIDPDRLPVSVHDVLVGRVDADAALLELPAPVAGLDEPGPAEPRGPGALTLLPASIDLAGTELHLLTKPGREHVLGAALAPLHARFDTVLIDTPPALGTLTLNALTAADAVLIPLQCEALGRRGVGRLLETIADVRRFTNPRLAVLGAIATMYDPRTRHARETLQAVRDEYGIAVLEPPVPKSVRFAEAPDRGRSILEHAPSSPGAAAYRALARALHAA